MNVLTSSPKWQPPDVTDVVEFDHAHLKYGGKVLKPKQSLGYLTPTHLKMYQANYKHSTLQHATGIHNRI